MVCSTGLEIRRLPNPVTLLPSDVDSVQTIGMDWQRIVDHGTMSAAPVFRERVHAISRLIQSSCLRGIGLLLLGRYYSLFKELYEIYGLYGQYTPALDWPQGNLDLKIFMRLFACSRRSCRCLKFYLCSLRTLFDQIMIFFKNTTLSTSLFQFVSSILDFFVSAFITLRSWSPAPLKAKLK